MRQSAAGLARYRKVAVDTASRASTWPSSFSFAEERIETILPERRLEKRDALTALPFQEKLEAPARIRSYNTPWIMAGREIIRKAG
jgi:hypothetical protein